MTLAVALGGGGGRLVLLALLLLLLLLPLLRSSFWHGDGSGRAWGIIHAVGCNVPS